MALPFRFAIASGVIALLTSGVQAQFLGKSLIEWSKQLYSADDVQRRSAAFALGKLGASAVPAIDELKRVAGDKNPKVRETALYALGEIGLKSATVGNDPGLQAVLVGATKDTDPLVRRSAAFAIGCMAANATAARKDVEALIINKDSSADVRQAAAWALGRLGDEGIPTLATALRDSDPFVVRDAAQSIGQLDPKAARAAIADLARLGTHPDLEVRKASLFALVGIVKPVDRDSPTVVGPLQKALLDGDEEVRRNGAFALSNIGGPPAAPAVDVLLDALKNGEVEVKRQAAAAFGNIGPSAERAVPVLIESMKLTDGEMKANAIQALGGIGRKAEPAVPALVDIVGDRNDAADGRQRAAVALSKIGDVKAAVVAAPRLLDVVSDPHDDGKVRERVLWALRVHNVNLREMKGVKDSFRRVLAEPANDKNRMVRQDCAYLTGMVFQKDAPPEVFPVLLQYLQDESLSVYQSTATAVGGAAQEAAVGKALSRELGEGDGRKLALDALHAIGADLVRQQPAIVDQVRKLSESDRASPLFKQQCKKYLDTVK